MIESCPAGHPAEMYLQKGSKGIYVFLHQVCPETNIVMINIGLLLLAFSVSDEEHCRYLLPVSLFEVINLIFSS